MSMVMSLRSRGASGSAGRAAKVLSRFGATAGAMKRRLLRYEELTSYAGVLPTWPTTACVLGRHPDLLRAFADRGIELALHGLVHGDHAALDHRQQREAIARAIDVFERAGIRATGFRGPYLRFNEATRDVLRELGLRYNCSQAVFFPLRGIGDGTAMDARYEMALALYSAIDARRVAVIPRLCDGLVDIPVAIPDDEILADRLDLRESERTAAWLGMLEQTHDRGDLFTIQLHPERIDELGEPLRATLAEAGRRRPDIFIARLDDIASWWLRRSRFQLHVTRLSSGRHHVRLEADHDASLIARGLDVEGEPWHGRESLCRSADFEVEAPRAPMVGVSARTPEAVRAFLTEAGFPWEPSERPDSYGAFIDIEGVGWTETEVLGLVDASPGPLLRIGRWPAGARSALAVTGDIDALTLRDFAVRSWETRKPKTRGSET